MWPENETHGPFKLVGNETVLDVTIMDHELTVDRPIATGHISLLELVATGGQPTWCVRPTLCSPLAARLLVSGLMLRNRFKVLRDGRMAGTLQLM